MDDTIWFVGLPYDDDRDEATPADRQRLAEVLAEQGFRSAPTEIGSALEVWSLFKRLAGGAELGRRPKGTLGTVERGAAGSGIIAARDDPRLKHGTAPSPHSRL